MSAHKKAMMLSDIFQAIQSKMTDGKDEKAASKEMDKAVGPEWRIFILPDDAEGRESPGTKFAEKKPIDAKAADQFFTRVSEFLEQNPLSGRHAAETTELDAAAELPQVKKAGQSEEAGKNPVSCLLRKMADMIDGAGAN